MKKYIKSIIVCLFVVMTANAQDNNSSISEDLKSIWNRDNSTPSDDIYPIGSAATESGENPGLGGGSDTVADAPIDGGLSVLLAAGVVVGARRIRREVNKSKDKEKNPAK
ncbi:MAG: PID-CTERM protein-sorting domain-containing protein [Chitinophagaceae bacterium]|jgi:hypothetical protein